MKILAKVLHGSKMYSLDGPNSDTDYKGIFLPPLDQLILMRASKNETYNVKEDNAQYENYALQKFLQMCVNAEDITISLLHASPHHVIIDSPVYKYLRDNRSRFYTKSMTGGLKFAKNMALKYSLRADRMCATESIVRCLEEANKNGVVKISQIWDQLPRGQHIYEGEEPLSRNIDKRWYEVSGKKILPDTAVYYALDIYKSLLDSYGERVKTAKSLENKDLKAISHSFRIGYELKQIFTQGDFSFPLPQNDFIRKVKFGEIDYIKDDIDSKLNELISEVELLSEKSTFNDRVDQDWVDSIILGQYQFN